MCDMNAVESHVRSLALPGGPGGGTTTGAGQATVESPGIVNKAVITTGASLLLTVVAMACWSRVRISGSRATLE